MSTVTGRRILVLVCDSFGVGGAPDAEAYGDAGSDTLGNTSRAVGGLSAPNLARLGLGHLTSIEGVAPEAAPGTAHGALVERSAGKDTTTGHWEMAGVVLETAFPLYPDGFPPEVIGPFEAAIGREVLGNKPASGTEILDELGAEHLRTGAPIVYTSGDSVFQIAAHTDVVPLGMLYEWSQTARGLLRGRHEVGRVIARPFEGPPGAFVRRPERRDYSVPPPRPTLLEQVAAAGIPVYGVGKIRDIFVERGLTDATYSSSNDDGVDRTLEYLGRAGPSLVVTNLVDFDSKYGHRNDPAGYAACVEHLDVRMPELTGALHEDGLLFLTGDHGCDPTTEPTDHSRERTPCLVAGLGDAAPVDLGDRAFSDLGATVAEVLGVHTTGLAGESFAGALGLG